MTEKTFMNRNRERIEEDEKEIAELEKAQGEDKQEDTSEKKEEKLSPEEGNFKKRYADLQRHLQKKEDEWKERLDAKEKELSNSRGATMPKTKEQVEEWVKKYPDVAAIVERLADQTAASRDEKIDARLKQVEEMSNEVTAKRAESELLKLHPDFEQIKETQEFFDWLDEQPTYISDSLYGSLDVKGAARALDLYKYEKGIKTASNKDAAKQVSSKSGGNKPQDTSNSRWSESKVQKLSDRDYEKFEEEIMEAIKNNKFSYDLSASAR